METLGRQSKIVSRPVPVPEDLPFEADAVEMEYPFLGHRQYTHGSSMLEGMLRVLRQFRPALLEENARIKQFKVMRPFADHSRAEGMLTRDVAQHPRLGKAVARLDVEAGSERLTSLLFPTESPITWRLGEYNAANYVEKVYPDPSEGDPWGRLIRVKDYIDLIRGINEVNRQLTVQGFPDPNWSKTVRWAYICNIPILSDHACTEMERVSFQKKNLVDLGNHRFEIKSGRLEGRESIFLFEICFFIELPAGSDKEVAVG